MIPKWHIAQRLHSIETEVRCPQWHYDRKTGIITSNLAQRVSDLSNVVATLREDIERIYTYLNVVQHDIEPKTTLGLKTLTKRTKKTNSFTTKQCKRA